MFKTQKQFLSYECKKSIPILDAQGHVLMPHLLYDNFKELRRCARHIEKNKTILRHIDVQEMINLICYISKKNLITDNYKIENYFETVADINIINLKIYYLRVLTLLRNNYEKVYKHFQKKKKKMYESIIKITTSDAYTLTDGPTIFITEDVEKMGRFYLQVSNIPETELDKILKIMNKNEKFIMELGIY